MVQTPVESGSSSDVTLPPSVFDKLKAQVYQFRYDVELTVKNYVGGTPTDENVASGWIRTKLGDLPENQLAEAVKEVIESRPGITSADAIEEVARRRNLSGFRRDFETDIARLVQQRASTVGVNVLDAKNNLVYRQFTPEDAAVTFGELYAEGRQIKAMLKEAVSIAMAGGRIPARKWGTTNKGALGFFVEHAFVVEDRIHLGITDPDRVSQSFVHTFRGSGIKLEEVLNEAVINFTLLCDYDFEAAAPDFWAHVFLTGEQNGLGASRSQGFGRFSTTRFERVPLARPVRGSDKLARADAAAAAMAAEIAA